MKRKNEGPIDELVQDLSDMSRETMNLNIQNDSENFMTENMYSEILEEERIELFEGDSSEKKQNPVSRISKDSPRTLKINQQLILSAAKKNDQNLNKIQ